MDQSSESRTEAQARPEAEPGAAARLVGVFFSPPKTFESIARRPGWVIPVVLLLVWTLASSYVITSRLDVDAILKKQADAMEKRGQTLPADQAERMRTTTEFFVKKLSPILILCWVAVTLFIVPALYHGLTTLWGKGGRYLTIVSAYAHVQLVQVLKGALLVAVALPRAKLDPEELPRLLKSNVGAFLDPEGIAAPLRVLLTNLDVFDLWGLALCIIALPRVTRVSTQGAAAIVFGVWAAYVVIAMAFGALGAAFSG